MRDLSRQDSRTEHIEPDLPPESAAAHLEALSKGIGDVDVIVQGLLSKIPPNKPWQRLLRSHLHKADRHVEILRLAISLERDATEIREAARQLKQVLEVASVQTAAGRADGWTRTALMVAHRNASLVSVLLSP
ncbi:hypothetical protein [Roseateles saccharophilus]|uniref:Uncharacterized protein n=1 Tax=Roseateles saccharophilus TaxID=304 RepID=A0A4R3U9M0_ROSSA|nr:hypothetical protein [Roseateles saccharophilus]MBL8278680.1 hypothetical protein [Roseateles sp.]MDG0835852.1 hypothetical protein [Roseateles saccharophilus]TCU83275.1 hypothetical protein EV671_10594 [Roseateles saccharophilus]